MKEKILKDMKDIATITDYKTRQRTYLLGSNLLYGCKVYVEDISKPNCIYVMGENKNELEK